MDKNALTELLEDSGVEYLQSGEEVLTECPYCDSDKKKLSFNADKGVYKCWICNAAGPVQKGLASLGVDLGEDFEKELAGREKNLQVVEAYLASRGFQPSDEYPTLRKLVEAVRMDYEPSREQVLFKYQAPGFSNYGIKCKKIDKNAKNRFYHDHKEGAPKFYIPNIKRWNGSDSVVIVEGEEDAIAWELFGHNSLASTGMTKTQFCDQLDNFETIYICFDNDLDPKTRKKVAQAEAKLLSMIRNMYPEADIRIIGLPKHVKDSNDALLQNYGAEDFARWKVEAREYLAGRVIRSASFYLDTMTEFLQDTSKTKGLPTGFPGLDEALGGGERLGEIDALVAEGKTGKNCLLHQKIYNRVESGTPVGYLSRELSPASEVLPNLFSIHTGYNFWKLKESGDKQYQEQLEKAKQALDSWNLFFAQGRGYIEIEQIAQFIREGKKRGINFYYLDHFHRCMLDSESNKEVAKFIHELKTLVSEENIHLSLIVQPTKLPQHQERISYKNMRGSVAIEQEVDQIFEFSKVPDETNITCLKLAAARHRLAKSGKKVYFKYDPETTRMNEVEVQEAPQETNINQPGADYSLHLNKSRSF